MTRKEYMDNSNSETHFQYYSQFVTDGTKAFVRNRIGLDKIRKSKDKHLNDVVPCFRSYHGGNEPMWLWDLAPINTSKLQELGECNSRATHTCVAKAAARILLEEETVSA